MIKRIENITSKILEKLNIKTVKEINPIKIAQFFDVDVKKEKLDYSISGFFVQENGKKYIRYNSSESIQRIRFTIAHELGHLILMHNKPSISVIKQGKLYRDNNSSSGEIKEEREANAFAASLLMPAEFIHNEIEKAPSEVENAIEYLAETFNVSEQAMMFRLMNLGYSVQGSY